MKFVKIINLVVFLLVLTVGAQAFAQYSASDKYGVPEKVTNTTSKVSSAVTGNDNNNEDDDYGSASGEDDKIYLNATDVDIKDLIKQISKATGKNFLIEEKIRGKITIISEKPMTKSMAYQAFLSALAVMGYTTVETPGGLTKIVQTKQAIQEPLGIYKDNHPYTDKFVTRIIQMKNISANELSSVVKSLVSKEGNLFAYPATNSLIITDSGTNIERILKIVRELDTEGPQEVLEIIPIENADAKDITDKIMELYADKIGDNNSNNNRRRVRARGAPELEEAPSISKVIADDRTNSMIVLGSKRAILELRSLISKLDTPVQGADGTIHVYYLKHANAKEMAEVLSSLVGGSSSSSKSSASKSKSKSKAAASSGSVQLEGGVQVTADEATNSMVITASPKDFETLITQVVRKLDIPRRQVYLEAVVMELTSTNEKDVGVSGNLGNVFSMFGENVTGFGALLPTFSNEIASMVGALGGLGGGIFSQRTVSVNTSDGNTIEIPAVSAILKALEVSSNVNVLATPSVMTLDNQKASFIVGENIPIRENSSLTDGGVSQVSINRQDVGISLEVTPQVSESDTVRLELTQKIEERGQELSDGIAITKREVQTVVVARDQQTIAIGGLISDQQTATVRKVPLLGDVPVLGSLFRNKSSNKTKRNILIFVTPYIIREKADYLSILQKKIEERNLFIDLNYGRTQRKKIRQSIKEHASDLLDYKSAIWESLYGDSTQVVSSTGENIPRSSVTGSPLPQDSGPAPETTTP